MLTVRDLEFRVEGLTISLAFVPAVFFVIVSILVQGSGFRVQGSGFRVEG